ncbi:glycosyltransferase [Flavobacterium sp. CFBP9031]|uniref:glycosyltransferase family 2 protein n=1 Tax=Flavobacterium sp. CFBP9031 TaxID=3096538 RepID=UPI002A69ED0E|nr:glycosyltransferase [Flavobacterium sp. CFBP9031]MDY0987429.1 glycosyltransferase [Flavobacterium sp. CFBP9031]
MKFSLIICTYMRPEPLVKLLNSVNIQSKYPDEILIIDGSLDKETKKALDKNNFKNLKYFLVSDRDRGLTRQRNFGISKVASDSEIVCFLDDDIVLETDYFENLLNTYNLFPSALGAAGYIINNNAAWSLNLENEPLQYNHFYYDGWKRKYSQRYVLRKKMGLLDDCPPGFMPESGNAKALSFFPPTNKIYPTESFSGGVSSFRKEILDKIKFSEYFEGYGLYEDTDFTFRLSKLGNIYVNTSAKLYHYHDEAGRPNKFEYGKMVLRNGWYVWRVAFPKPRFKSRIEWNLIAWLLIIIRASNIVSTKKKKEAITETLGRIYGWFSIIINPPKEKK